VEQLFGLSQSAQRFYGLVCSRAEDVWPKLTDSTDDKVVMNLGKFLLEPPAIKVELIRRSLTTIGSGEKDLSHRHYERILQLAQQNISSKKIELPGRFTVQREYGNLIFARPQATYRANEEVGYAVHTKLEVPGQTGFGQYLIEATILDAGYSILDTRRKTKSKIQFMEHFDLEKVKLPLFVRFRDAGDKFWPLGLPAEKKVGKFLTAAKVPQQVRAGTQLRGNPKILIVADSEKIIWVWPIRISEQAKITSDTRRILQLQITDANSAKIS